MGVWQSTHLNNEISVEESSEGEDPNFIACPDPSYRHRGLMNPENFVTDAVEAQAQAVPFQPLVLGPCDDYTITQEKVCQFENELEFYEKVALVYLLYDDAEVALQHLIQLQEGAHLSVIFEWVQYAKKTDPNWHRKLLEGLCIIQNYEIITNLSYTKKDVDERFLPHNPNSAMFINISKKKMYRIFDNFSIAETRKFLNYVEDDFRNQQLPFRYFDNEYLEMYMLYWTTIKYILPTDLTKLSKIFKYMGMFEVSESLCPNVTNEQSMLVHGNASTYENVCNCPDSNFRDVGLTTPDKSFTSFPSGSGSSTIGEDRIRKNSYEKNSYSVNPECPGTCLIINQRNFYREPDQKLQYLLSKTDKPFEDRKGTDADRDSLKDTFELFGFNVVMRDNLIHSEIVEEIAKAARMVPKHSSLMICILSHGIRGMVYGVNSIPVRVEDIRNVMCRTNVKNLKDQPKILILQSCQGTQCQQVTEDDDENDDEDTITTDGPGGVPRTADMLLFWATVPGYSAVRDKEKGTWFIQSLCKTVRENSAKMHFEEICTLVKKEVVDMRWETKKETKAMVPYKESTLRRFFFLPPVKIAER